MGSCLRAQGVESDRGVGVGAAGAHLGRHPDRLHDLAVLGTSALCEPGVAADAVGALRHVRDRHRNQLLGLLRQRPVGEDLFAECLEGVVGLGRELRPVGGELPRRRWIDDALDELLRLSRTGVALR